MDPLLNRKWSLNNLFGDEDKTKMGIFLFFLSYSDIFSWTDTFVPGFWCLNRQSPPNSLLRQEWSQMWFWGENDPQMRCEMHKVTLNRTHDSIMAAALRAIQILSVWLILCNKPIMPGPALYKTIPCNTVQYDEFVSDKCNCMLCTLNLNNCTLPQTNSSLCAQSLCNCTLRTISVLAVNKKWLQDSRAEQRAHQSLLIKFVCICPAIESNWQQMN